MPPSESSPATVAPITRPGTRHAPRIQPGPPEARRHYPATARNRDPIRAVLTRVLPEGGGVLLELASGSGEHAAALGPALPAGWTWRPSDGDEPSARAAATLLAEAAPARVEAPVLLDVSDRPWPANAVEGVAAMAAINLVHIAPWAVTGALMAEAGAALPVDGVLYLYGPYRVGGRHTADSNAAFDASLRRQDPAWGVRDLEAVVDEAARHGLILVETVAMPANNLSVILRKAGV
ncbi:DUF938 domain-containing protein [Roseospira visakhapatnamensis]|uniref:SAM-dependent methyltransferase n=1 Tax=Roseospira visakhapatnamensis TaxID=390880 RepID=A0A7W6WA79_9PROT|nr:DUF938 domain-containing protein [Roseospira visakhapatnamensis]MBB4266704.1 hypothetical protein [Roseospira visakhapatnamensis]